MICYEENYTLRQSDFDYKDNVKLSCYLDFFQDIASKHATSCGLGFQELKKLGVAWVVTKIKLEIYQSFSPYENIKIVTYPHKKGVIDYIRDYYVYKTDGSLAVKGTSQWCHIDFIKRKLVRPQVDFDGEFYPKNAFEGRIERVMPVENNNLVLSHTINKSDLDHNNHTNNIKYADMVYNALPCEIVCKSFVINYIKESNLGDKIDFFLDKKDNAYFLTGMVDGKESFSAKVEY